VASKLNDESSVGPALHGQTEGRHFEATQHYFYEHMYVYSIFISIFERLSQLNFEIHKVGHQERLTVDGDIIYH
jgi:hypothetical protein